MERDKGIPNKVICNTVIGNTVISDKKIAMASQAPFGEKMNQALPPREEEKKKTTQDIFKESEDYINKIIKNKKKLNDYDAKIFYHTQNAFGLQ
jgi:hypothetical protein